MQLRRTRWLRFRPTKRPPTPDDPFAVALYRLEQLLPRHPRIDRLERYIDLLMTKVEHGGDVSDRLALLFAQSPRAARAQVEMDRHHRGYHNKSKRLFELIDFNDTFVAAVLAIDPMYHADFAVKVKIGCDDICRRANITPFTDEQWDAITRGLSREVAVYQAALDSGFDAFMTSRANDALGIDMQIRDPSDGRYVNIDCKTPSAFRHRLEELLREGRITIKDLYRADERGYAIQINGHAEHKVQVVLLCILQERLSEIVHFKFRDTGPIRELFNRLIRDHGLADNRYGEDIS